MPGQKDGEQFRKVFIGGLSYETQEQSLREHFEEWGNVVDCVVMRDPNTSRSRGFGFVTYEDPESVNEAQGHRPHKIDDKEVEVKRATPREESNKPNAHLSVKKAYVSGIKDEHTEEDLQEYFEKYGTVENCQIILEKDTNKKRGFAFVTFDDYDPVDKICLQKRHIICGHNCDVKKALPKDQQQQRGGDRGGNYNSYRMGGGGGGRNYDNYEGGMGGWGNNGSFGMGGGGSYAGYGMGGGSRGGRGGGRGSYGSSGGSNNYSRYSSDSYSGGGGGGGGGGYEYDYNNGGGYGSSNYGGGAMRGNQQYKNSGGTPYGASYGRSNSGGGGGGYSQNRY